MSAVISISTGKSYGVSRVCRVWSLSRSSVYRDLKPSPAEPPVRRRPGPHVGCGACRGDQTSDHQQPVLR